MRKQVLFLSVSLLLVAGATWAGTYGTVNMTYQNDNYPNSGGSTPPTAYIYHPGATSNGYDVYVGRSNFLITGVSDNLPNYNPLDGMVGKNITAYCVDIYQWINYNQPGVWQVDALGDAPQQNPLLSGTMGAQRAKLLSELADKYMSQVTTATKAAAFQADVWEIVNETLPGGTPSNGATLTSLGYNVTSGSFSLYGGDSASFAGQANTWLSGLLWPGDDASPDYSLVSLDTQDFGLLYPTTSSQPPVPEPVTMFSAFIAISGLGAYIRKRMRVQVA